MNQIGNFIDSLSSKQEFCEKEEKAFNEHNKNMLKKVNYQFVKYIIDKGKVSFITILSNKICILNTNLFTCLIG